MPRILIVEDNELSRDMLSRRLEKRGYEVATAADGEEGVAKASADAPDLILMDLAMPVLDGWEATRRIKAGDRTAGIPVIGLSAHAMAEDADRARRVGCDDFDTKPVELPATAVEDRGAARAAASALAGRLWRAETRVEVAARVESLGTVRAFVENACRRAGADAESCFDLKLAVDEACTNIIEHGYAGRPDGTIAVSCDATRRHAPGDHPGPRPELHARFRRPRRRRVGLERPARRRSRLAFHPQLRGRGRLRSGSRGKPIDSHEEEPEVTEIRIDVVARGPVEVVVIAGSVDGATAPSLVAAFRQRVGEGRIRIVGDFAGVDYISSAGLRALLETVKEARQRGGDLRLAAVQPDVRRVLDLAGFTGILKLYANVEEAVASFPGTGA